MEAPKSNTAFLILTFHILQGTVNILGSFSLEHNFFCSSETFSSICTFSFLFNFFLVVHNSLRNFRYWNICLIASIGGIFTLTLQKVSKFSCSNSFFLDFANRLGYRGGGATTTGGPYTTRNLAFCDNKKSSLKIKKSSLYEYSDDFFHCHMVVTDSMSQIDPCDNPLKVATKSCYSMTRTKSSLIVIILWRLFLSLFHIFFCHKCSKSRHKFEVYNDDLGSSLPVLVFSDKNSHYLMNLHVSDNLHVTELCLKELQLIIRRKGHQQYICISY